MGEIDDSDLPPLYAAWMRDLAGDLARESRATCLDCAMCEPHTQDEAFDPAVKCCTYVPYLPSFLVGAILADDTVPAGAAAAIRARIAKGDAVTPLGVGRTLPERVLYDRAGFSFGRDRAVRCPYQVEGGLCGIWKHRNSVCATWFCKHVRGGVGRRFWLLVHQLLERAEAALARHCALTLGIDGDALALVMSPLVDGGVSKWVDGSGPAPFGEEPPAVWSDWDWRVEAYFLACAEIVKPLAWRDVVAIGGSDLAMAESAVRHAHARMASGEIPEHLAPATLRVRPVSGEVDRVWTYSPFDPLDLPRTLTSGLRVFAGRTVPEALAALGVELGDDPGGDASGSSNGLSETRLRTLIDFEILVPASNLTRRSRRSLV